MFSRSQVYLLPIRTLWWRGGATPEWRESKVSSCIQNPLVHINIIISVISLSWMVWQVLQIYKSAIKSKQEVMCSPVSTSTDAHLLALSLHRTRASQLTVQRIY